MVEGGRNRSTALQRLAKWPTTSPSSMNNWSESKKHGTALENSYFQPIYHENLVQGSLYIMKVKIVTIALFEGWNDDMCCFSVLRSDTECMRWSEARYLPGDFEAFDAFDDAGNPPVYFWTRFLRVKVPVNWFSLFEEARQRQRMWNMDMQQHYIHQQQQQRIGIDEDEDDMISFPGPTSSISSLPLDSSNGINDGHTKAKPALSSDTNQGISFSQVRHGSPTIFSDGYTTRATTSQGNYSDQPPLAINNATATLSSTAEIVYAPRSPSSSSSSIIGSIPVYHSDHTLYSPVPSTQYPLSTTKPTMTPTELYDINSLSST